MSGYADAIVRDTATLVGLYESTEPGSVRAACDAIQAASIDSFFTALDALRDEFRSQANLEMLEIPPPPRPFVEVSFSGDEAWGQNVDLADLFSQYINVRAIPNKAMAYLNYLDVFATFSDTPSQLKDASYGSYVAALHGYLVGFLQRSDPLYDYAKLDAELRATFERDWAAGKVAGWAGVAAQYSPSNALYCAACDAVFAKPSVLQGHLAGKKHQKAAARPPPPASAELARLKVIAAHETRIVALATLLKSAVESAKMHAERKQARSAAEIAAEAAAAARAAAGDSAAMEDDALDELSADSDEMAANPLQLPLGPDGKPIPVWLYKLHGLHQRFTCQICGDFSYRGPKVFELHFADARHSAGMRALGLPNTKAFHGITQIDEARRLWQTMQSQDKAASFNPTDAEECEDAAGNVMPRKTYERLVRQGLIE